MQKGMKIRQSYYEHVKKSRHTNNVNEFGLAWEASTLPLSYTRMSRFYISFIAAELSSCSNPGWY